VSIESAHEKIRSDISEYGWQCLSVGQRADDPDEDFVSFCYTIGLTVTFEHPELIIFGLPQASAHDILAECVSKLRKNGVIPQDQRVPDILADDLDVVLRPMREEYYSEYLGTAVRYFGDESVRALVVFWPDANNVLPWEPGCKPTGQEATLDLV